MPTRDVIVIGASAGGVEALRQLAATLPADLPAAVLVVLHLPAGGFSALPAILSRSGPLPAQHAQGGEKLEPGRILVAPVDHHLLVTDSGLELGRGPKENGHRPAVDVLFRSAARALGPRVIGVVLSGSLDDGTAGLGSIAARGGRTVVQDPRDALYVAMPRSALAHVAVDHVVPIAGMAEVLSLLCREEIPAAVAPPPEPMEVETDVAMLEPDALLRVERPGRPAGLGCPQCHGALFEIDESNVVHYRCRIGHAWSPESLLVEQSEALENALWMALRVLEDRAALCRRLGEPARQRGHVRTAGRYEQREAESRRAAEVIREVLERAGGLGESTA